MIFAVYAISELTNFRNVTKCGSGSHHTIVCPCVYLSMSVAKTALMAYIKIVHEKSASGSK